jgi:N-acetylglucosamine-6-sulfatase
MAQTCEADKVQSDPYQINNLYQADLSALVSLPRSAVGVLGATNNILGAMAEPVSISNSSAQQGQVNNMEVGDSSSVADLTLRLDALLMVLKTCSGRQCTHPWENLFPDGEVRSLADALDKRYHDFFATRMERVQFDKCEKGYIAESEGPMWSGATHVYGMNHEMAVE